MAHLLLRFLGGFEASLNDSPLAFATDKARALLAYLAVESGQAHTRSSLAALLWPDYPEENARTTLRHVLHLLRQLLGDDKSDQTNEAAAYLLTTRQTLQFNSAASHTLDVFTFTSLLNQTKTHVHDKLDSCSTCLTRLHQATELYRGDFLGGLAVHDSVTFEEWRTIQQERLRLMAVNALDVLARHAEVDQDFEGMAINARRRIEIDPLGEGAQEQLMRALALTGQRSAAVAHFAGYARLLRDELGIEPSQELNNLCDRIRAGQITPSAPTRVPKLAATATTTPATTPPTQGLPAQLTPFFGRDEELAEITTQLRSAEVDTASRLITLIGWGGSGKTRLAIEAARLCLGHFPDGVYFVSLAALIKPNQIAPAIAASLGLSPSSGNPVNVLQSALRTKHVLLVLDNLEHLLAHPVSNDELICAALIVQILEAAPHVCMLATSRESLNVRGERVIEVQGMSLSGDTFAEMAQAAPVRLFVQSAHVSQPTFKLTEDNAPQIARICRLVQGMPLGLELAAASVGALSLSDIASEIERSAEFLAHDWHDAPTRQRSMRAVFDWSWQLLNEAEQRALQQLAIFQGGFTRAAAEAVTGTTWQMLARLMRKSLVRQTSPGRYDMHELVRQFARARLNASGERDAVMARHSAWFLDYVAAHERRLVRNEPREAAAEIMVELDNVRQAWIWAAEQVRVQALRGAAYGLWQFYVLKGYLAEGERMFALVAAGVARVADVGDGDILSDDLAHILSRCLAAQAHFMNLQVRYAPAVLMAQRAIAIGSQCHDHLGEAIGHLRLGQALTRTGKTADAGPHFDQALSLAHLAEDAQPEDVLAIQDVVWDIQLWQTELIQDQFPGRAAQAVVETLSFCRKHDTLYGQLRCLLDLIEYMMDTGDDAAAEAYLNEAQTLAQRVNNLIIDVSLLYCRGLLLAIRDEYSLATATFEHAVEISRTYTDELHLFGPHSVVRLGQLACMLGDDTSARHWLERGLHLSRAVNNRYQQMIGEKYLTLLALQIGNATDAEKHAEDSLSLARELKVYIEEAICTTFLGRAFEESHRLDEACVHFESARRLFASLPRRYFAVEPVAGLARIALVRDDLTGALAYAEEVLTFLNHRPCTGLNEPFLALASCVRVLQAVGDGRAVDVLHMAHTRLHEYASHIPEGELRQSYLGNIASHRELEAMWQNNLANPTAALVAPPPPLPSKQASVVAPRHKLWGRSADIAHLTARLDRTDCQLVTLIGPPGVGKTSLGLQVARQQIQKFSGGVVIVEMASISEPGLVLPTIAHTLAAPERAGQTVQETLIQHLRDKTLLLMLDNFEHVLAAAPSLGPILARCPQLKILATSRAPLQLREEHRFSVEPLKLPSPAERSNPERLQQADVVQLFEARAQSVKPDFQLTQANVQNVAELCIRLDGLPLAIELAAARIRLMTPQAMLARLEKPLNLLRNESQAYSTRQQTLRNAIAWSYALLSEHEQRLFRSLAVFVDGFTVDAAERVCADASGSIGRSIDSIDSVDVDVLTGIESLLDKSLLQSFHPSTHPSAQNANTNFNVQDDVEQEPRFRMLESIRAYALERLEADPAEAQTMHRRHVHFFLALAEQAEPLVLGAQQSIWLRRIQTEHNNFRAALDGLAHASNAHDAQSADAALRLVAALRYFWYAADYLTEGLQRCQRALAHPLAVEHSAVRARALNAAGYFHHVLGQPNAACPLMEEALVMGREVGDKAVVAYALQYIAVFNPWRDLTQARAYLEESVALFRGLNRPFNLATTLVRLGDVAQKQHAYDLAEACYEESVALMRQVNNRLGLPFAMRHQAYLLIRRDDLERASALCTESLAINLEMNDLPGVAACLLACAVVALKQRKFNQAIRLLAASDGVLEAQRTQLLPADQQHAVAALEALRAEVDATTFTASYAAGRSLTLKQAAELSPSD